MERRVLLAIFLAFLVLYAWQALFVKPVPKPGAGQPAKTGAPASAGASESPLPASPTSGASVESGTLPAAAGPSPAALPAEPLVGDTVEHEIRVETREVIAIFTNRGARLKSWRLKRYLNPAGEPQELVENG